MRAACAARVPGFAADRERRVLLLLPITPGLEHRAGQIEQTVVEQNVARQFQALADEIGLLMYLAGRSTVTQTTKG